MKKEYCSPKGEFQIFDLSDVIAVSGEQPSQLKRESAGNGDDWNW